MTVASIAASGEEGVSFPSGWALARLGEVCQLNPRRAVPITLPDDVPMTFVPMPALDADAGAIVAPEIRPLFAVRKGFTAFPKRAT